MPPEEEYQEARKVDSSIRKYTRQQIVHGEVKERYWTSEKFMNQIKHAVKIVEVKYLYKR